MFLRYVFLLKFIYLYSISFGEIARETKTKHWHIFILTTYKVVRKKHGNDQIHWSEVLATKKGKNLTKCNQN